MDVIKKFNHGQFGNLRVCITNDQKTMFNLADVCRALDINNPRQVKSRLAERGVITADTPTQNQFGATVLQPMTYIDEANLYRCIFQSRKEEAESFQNWVFEEVLPQIRRTGGYIPIRNTRTGEVLTADEVLARANRILQRTIECKNLPADGCITTTDIAKTLDMETKDLNSFLTDVGVLKWKRGQFRLTPTYEGQGLAMDRLFIYYSKDGKQKERTYLVWTPKGAEMISKMIK